MKIGIKIVTFFVFPFLIVGCTPRNMSVSVVDKTIGDGKTVEDGDIAVIDYNGLLPSGRTFDNTDARGPFCFVVGT
ncbi:MAG: hypothetical protein KDH89_05615, partial [Anaerolineae bacterium]|nr:hypothetical protein [Anaerolineae bacterium]